MPGMNDRVCDAHLHVWQFESERYPWSPLRNMRPDYEGTVETLLDKMERNGVSKAVIVQPSNYGYDHRYVLDCLARYPDHFAAVALLDFKANDATQRLTELVAQGFRGARLFFYGDPDVSWIDTAPTHRVLARADELGAILTVFGRWDNMDVVYRLAQEHPSLRIVVDHLGHPDVEKQETWPAVLRLADLPNVYIKVSDFATLSRRSYPYADVSPFVREVHAAFGARRMMWASNFPNSLAHLPYEQSLTLVRNALPDLPPAEMTRIMGGTVAELWDL
jgi:predicted TIM-barrel fold metal-dependent hydrolase